MSQRDAILDAIGALARAQGRLPSLLEVAREVGLTKQGVLHHFPSRAALDEAVVLRAVERIDAALRAAAGSGASVVTTYLRLSQPDDLDVAAAATVLGAAGRHLQGGVLEVVRDAATRWEQLFADEVGDPVRAEVVRLVGDGLFAEALATERPPDAARVDRLAAHLIAPAGGEA